MPIQIMIVLFIAFAVGMLVLMFSENLLNSANDQLIVKNDDIPKEQFIEVISTSNTQIGSLVDTCYKTHFGKVFNNETCFILKAQSDFSPDANEIKRFVSDENILGEVTGSSKIFVIKWNFEKTKVEVES